MEKQTQRSIGVVGAGKWGRNIIKTLHGLDALHAIAEVDDVYRQQMSELYPQIDIFDDHEKMYHANIDVVVIATPVITHYELAKQALLLGKDVFVEKPMTFTADESRHLTQIAKEKDCVLMVGHMLLYQPAIQFIKQYLNDGHLGKVYSLHQVRRNLGTIRTQVNVLYSLGVHDLAVLAYLVGESAQSVTAAGQSIVSPGIEDDMTVHIQYASGIQAHLHICWLWPVKDRHLMILGEKGALLYDELNHTVTLYRHYANADATVSSSGGSEIIYRGSNQPLTQEMQHFLDCVHSHQQPLSSGQQGLEVVELMESITKQLSTEELHVY